MIKWILVLGAELFASIGLSIMLSKRAYEYILGETSWIHHIE